MSATIESGHSFSSFMLTSLLHVLMLLSFTGAYKYCSEEKEATPVTVEDTTNRVRYCLAQCLDLVHPKKPNDECFYNPTNMRSKGCTARFLPDKVTNQSILCEDGMMNLSQPISDIWRVCDYMIFKIYHLDRKTYALQYVNDSNDALKRVKAMQKQGVKAISQIGNWDDAQTITAITDDPIKRDDFIQRITDTILKHNMDGVHLEWTFPGCPQAMNCRKSKVDRPNAVAFYNGLGKVMKENGKITISKISTNPLTLFEAGDYFSDIFPFMEFYLVELYSLAGHWMPSTDFHSGLAKARAGLNIFLNKVGESKIRTKIAFGLSLNTLAYELRDKKAMKMGSHTGKKSFLATNEWCKLVQPGGSYKVFNDTEKQSFAVKDGHLFVYDSMEDFRAKIQFYTGIGGGAFFVAATNMDDISGDCGCGKLPRLKAIGDFVKSKSCDPFPCF